MADISEFDPLSKPKPANNDDNNDPLTTSSTHVTVATELEEGYLEDHFQDECTLVSLHDDKQSNPTFDRKISDPTGSRLLAVVHSSPNMMSVAKPGEFRPSRPPPPPPQPSKKRAASANNLLDYNERSSNSSIKSSAFQRSNQQSSNSLFYTAPQFSDSKPNSLTRSQTGGSSFYTDSSPPVTRQPSGRLPHARNMSALEGDFSEISSRREQIMQTMMAKREKEYTIRKPFRIFTGTWNVNGQAPPEKVKKWLSTDDLKKDPPDLYFIGFQELDLSKEAMLFSESVKEDEWIRVVEKSLPKGNVQYKLLKCQRLVGMMLLVYVKKIHDNAICDLSFHQVGTGILGRMGNKGGVAVRLDLHNSTICAVNCHLAAHMEQCGRRNEDFHSICSKLRFPRELQAPLSLFQHDIVFWLGDLNYRIQALEAFDVKNAIDNGDYKILREYDQLHIEKSSGRVFNDFQEGVLDFRPTYKYDPGTDDWDTSGKFRTPAWCDRILWWEYDEHHHSKNGKPEQSVKLLEYKQHMALKVSDHKPVSALFEVKVKVIDQAKYKKVFEDENRLLDKLENECLPTMTLSHQHIQFGNVKFQETKLQTLEVVNTGMIPCNFEFISRPDHSSICKKWLTITDHKGCLFPGARYIIEFEVYINHVTAPSLNSGEDKLEDILILHLDGGKDFFITVNGKYVPSCFGTSIETLCRLRKPVAECTISEIQKLSTIQPKPNLVNTQEMTLAVPKELWTLIDHLYRHARKEEDLFLLPGLHSEIEEIRDFLDSTVDTGDGRNPLPGSIASSAEALLVFLQALPEPVIPYFLYEICLEVNEHFTACKQVLQGMSQLHRNVFKYILAFLRELLKYSDSNGLDPDTLASIFSTLMIRPIRKKSSVEIRIDRDRAKRFILNFLINPYDG